MMSLGLKRERLFFEMTGREHSLQWTKSVAFLENWLQRRIRGITMVPDSSGMIFRGSVVDELLEDGESSSDWEGAPIVLLSEGSRCSTPASLLEAVQRKKQRELAVCTSDEPVENASVHGFVEAGHGDEPVSLPDRWEIESSPRSSVSSDDIAAPRIVGGVFPLSLRIFKRVVFKLGGQPVEGCPPRVLW
jgi:hypothetical protein